jgi:hypothetical protein
MPYRLLFVLIYLLVCRYVLLTIHYDWRARKNRPAGRGLDHTELDLQEMSDP